MRMFAAIVTCVLLAALRATAAVPSTPPKAFSFTMVTTMMQSFGLSVPLTVKVARDGMRQWVETMPPKADPDGMKDLAYTITDIDSRKMFQVMPNRKTCHIQSYGPSDDSQYDVLWQILPPGYGPAKASAGDTLTVAPGMVIGGHATHLVRLVHTESGQAMTVNFWLAPTLGNLPLRTIAKSGGHTVTTTYHDVTLRTPDAKLFVPPPYCKA